MNSKSIAATHRGYALPIVPVATASASVRPVLRLRLLQPLAVPFHVAEFQRIDRRLRQLDRLPALVQQHRQALADAKPHVMAAVLADVQVLFQIPVKEHLAQAGQVCQRLSGISRRDRRPVRAAWGGRRWSASSFHRTPARPRARLCASEDTRPMTPFDHARHRLAGSIEVLRDLGDQRGTDNRGVAVPRHRRRLLGRLDAEADGDRQLGYAGGYVPWLR